MVYSLFGSIYIYPYRCCVYCILNFAVFPLFLSFHLVLPRSLRFFVCCVLFVVVRSLSCSVFILFRCVAFHGCHIVPLRRCACVYHKQRAALCSGDTTGASGTVILPLRTCVGMRARLRCCCRQHFPLRARAALSGAALLPRPAARTCTLPAAHHAVRTFCVYGGGSRMVWDARVAGPLQRTFVTV